MTHSLLTALSYVEIGNLELVTTTAMQHSQVAALFVSRLPFNNKIFLLGGCWPLETLGSGVTRFSTSFCLADFAKMLIFVWRSSGNSCWLCGHVYNQKFIFLSKNKTYGKSRKQFIRQRLKKSMSGLTILTWCHVISGHMDTLLVWSLNTLTWQ